MARLASILAAITFLMSSPAVAENRPVVVELFTSQGCSSCPPADALLHELAKRDDVIALALHVDYWDYIGWKDSFASREFTERQQYYARVNFRRMIYTPQMIINGGDHVVGNRPKDVADLITRHSSDDTEVALKAERDGDRLLVGAVAEVGAAGRATVRLFRYRPQSTVDIKRGENAGRTISYANVVTDMTVLSDWDMSQPLDLDVPIEGDLPSVVLIQKDQYGLVQAAVDLK